MQRMIRILKLFYQRCLGEFVYLIYCCLLSPTQLVEDTHKLNFPLNIEPEFFTNYNDCGGLIIINVFENTVEYNILLLWNPQLGNHWYFPFQNFQWDYLHVLD